MTGSRTAAPDLLRFVACGSVDDGKSTLVGRLLFDSGAIAEDRLAALEADSRAFGGGRLDFSLLLDGLAAEREQGITIDVAYRYFETKRRKFIIADAPGHDQYTRNMATACSRADAALLLVDAQKGILPQTLRHAHIARLMGVRHLALVVNKMDLSGYDQARFHEIAAEFAAVAGAPEIDITPIPVSALSGENIIQSSQNMGWYSGPSVLRYLEALPPDEEREVSAPFAMPVQLVNRLPGGGRTYAGSIAAGLVRAGDGVRILPSGREARIARIITMDGDIPEAAIGQAVSLALDAEVDCARGDVIVARDTDLEVADQFEADLIWMSEAPLLPGRAYRLKLGTAVVGAWVTEIKSETDVQTLEKLAAKTLALNAVGTVNIALNSEIPFAPYAANRELGSFILIDRETEGTVGAGMIHFALRRAGNIAWQKLEITREARAASLGQQPKVLWFTGLSGAGKSTVANIVDRKLHALGKHSYILDGDNIRHGLSKNLGFTDADRVENMRRVGEAAKLMTDAGLIVLVAMISPFRAEREMVRKMFPAGEFVEIFMDVPLEVAEERDPKGLYKKARAGEIANFTGLDSPYEPPQDWDVRIDTSRTSADEAADLIVGRILS